MSGRHERMEPKHGAKRPAGVKKRWKCAARPRAPRRMRGAGARGGEPEEAFAPSGEPRATLRIPLPQALLARVAAAPGRPAQRWGALEATLHESVYRWLPAGAREVQLAWDAARGEVVARFAPPA